MNRDDVVRFATIVWNTPHWTEEQINRLERFAELVADAECESCAAICENLVIFGSEPGLQKATLKDAAEAIRTRGV